MTKLRSLLRDRRGASAAEFALVLPLFLILLLGIVDAGRLMYELNLVKKATQVGARVAVVTAPVDPNLSTFSAVGHDPGSGTLTQGDIVPASTLGQIDCDDSTCTCDNGAGNCPWTPGYDGTAFNVVVNRMSAHYSAIGSDDVTISYLGSGLGFAGDPTGPDISPTVEVTVSGIEFTPITSLLFATFTLPDVRTSMTGEDQAGDESY